MNFITKWRRLRYTYVVNKEGHIIFVTKSLFNKNSVTWDFSETLSQLLEFFFKAPSGNANRIFFVLYCLLLRLKVSLPGLSNTFKIEN